MLSGGATALMTASMAGVTTLPGSKWKVAPPYQFVVVGQPVGVEGVARVPVGARAVSVQGGQGMTLVVDQGVHSLVRVEKTQRAGQDKLFVRQGKGMENARRALIRGAADGEQGSGRFVETAQDNVSQRHG